MIGDAPWALSAVPECFRQERFARGAIGHVAVTLPPGSQRLRPGTVVRLADCRLFVERDALTLVRGTERLVVPPHATAYLAGPRLTVVRRFGKSIDARVYGPSGAEQPRVETR